MASHHLIHQIAKLLGTYPGKKIDKESLIVQLGLMFGDDNRHYDHMRFLELADPKQAARLKAQGAR